MRITLTVWRQTGPDAPGAFETYDVPGISPDMSFLEMLDIVNERLIADGKEPIAFDHDCREGICGSCWMMINGRAARPRARHRHLPAAHAQVPRRRPRHHRAVAGRELPDRPRPHRRPQRVRPHHRGRRLHHRSPTGGAPDANLIPIPKGVADAAMDAAACIGCGACVAACPNGAAQLFTAAKVAHLNLLPQGQAERWDRTVEMVETMERYFGSCTNHGECEAACPKEIRIDFIALMNRDYVKAQLKQRRLVGQSFP